MKPSTQTEPSQNFRAFRTALIEDTANWFNHTDSRLTLERYCKLDQFLEKNIDSGQEPELILLFQSFSDQYSPRAVDRLFQKHPLSRILVVYGPYCESDGRTRQLWPQTVRVPLWKLSQRMEREIEVLSGNIPALPLTATPEEIVQFEYEPLSCYSPTGSDSSTAESLLTADSSASDSLIAQALIFSPDYAWAEMLCQALVSLYSSHCNIMHTLGEMECFLQANPDYCGQIFFDLDPYRPTIKNWLSNFLVDPGKNYIDLSGQTSSEPFASAASRKGTQPASVKENSARNGVMPPERIVAVTNWLTPHCRRELEQFGINRYACKLNLPGILEAASNGTF